jgi:DNA-binding CsgD family transcriptional regulator
MAHDSWGRQGLGQPKRTRGEFGVDGGDRARVVEADPLLRLHAEHAATDLGFAVVDDPAMEVEVCFVGLDSLDSCSRCGRRHWPDPGGVGRAAPLVGSPRPLIVGYVGGPPVLAAAHAAHFCADVVVRLQASEGRAAFVYVLPSTAATTPGPGRPDALPEDLTVREADVLLLVLAGRTTKEIAGQLCLSPATVRSHCRSLLVKAGAADRRALRASCLGGVRPSRATPESDTQSDDPARLKSTTGRPR